jgi:8-oxo-dGTP pyrophosphatase MutT (NUDIX family)
MKERYKYIAAVYLILQKENKILLLKRANTGYEDGNYSMVAGHMDGNETIKQAIIREAKEEAGITIEEQNIEIATFLHRKSVPEDQPERMDFFLKCENWTGDVTNIEQDKCSELSWYDLDNLPSNVIPCVRQAIENYKEGIVFYEYGWK